MFRVELESGLSYRFEAAGESQPRLNLFGLGEDEAEFPRDDASIVHTARRSGTHYVRVRNQSTNGDQRYTITSAPFDPGQLAWIMAMTAGQSGSRSGYPAGCSRPGSLTTIQPGGGAPGVARLEYASGRLTLILHGTPDRPTTFVRWEQQLDYSTQSVSEEDENKPRRIWQPFRNGSGLDVRLESVALWLGSVDSGDSLEVSVHADQNGAPAETALFVLELAPGQSLADGRHEFFAPADRAGPERVHDLSLGDCIEKRWVRDHSNA